MQARLWWMDPYRGPIVPMVSALSLLHRKSYTTHPLPLVGMEVYNGPQLNLSKLIIYNLM